LPYRFLPDKLSTNPARAGKNNKTKGITKMIGPEDYSLESREEVEDFLEMYTKSEYDSFRPAYNDYDFDMDNYGYDY
jgi:hypothetical protein